MYYEDSLEPGPGEATVRPQSVPDKFRDPETGAVRVEALLKAYQELERRLGGTVRVPGEQAGEEEIRAFHRAAGVPDKPEDYCIECRHPMLESDPEVNRRLHQAGFTPAQAQLVYDLAHERVIPTFEHMAGEHQASSHLSRLREHFGGDAKWTETARQLAAWGQANLPPEVYQTLSCSADGIIAMRHMMASGEPGLGALPAGRDDQPDEDELKRMLQDPRYWKKKDPAFIEKVSAGFRRLYGE
ncbi:capsid assembly protein [Magnetospirillum moscoviense]|uniref:Uncharacterized protein n=1 Tax=Magnetospirillum moscoviense TaxID=1437059 RepID=A0A178MXS5_9PROT|nr:hypothetical protein [Magnetospirillum moscoviense]OAN54242.1 hypothetical protein A6A05_08710 [Magnetospirillum moscoviense]